VACDCPDEVVAAAGNCPINVHLRRLRCMTDGRKRGVRPDRVLA
jgi:hypothetical protein